MSEPSPDWSLYLEVKSRADGLWYPGTGTIVQKTAPRDFGSNPSDMVTDMMNLRSEQGLERMLPEDDRLKRVQNANAETEKIFNPDNWAVDHSKQTKLYLLTAEHVFYGGLEVRIYFRFESLKAHRKIILQLRDRFRALWSTTRERKDTAEGPILTGPDIAVLPFSITQGKIQQHSDVEQQEQLTGGPTLISDTVRVSGFPCIDRRDPSLWNQQKPITQSCRADSGHGDIDLMLTNISPLWGISGSLIYSPQETVVVGMIKPIGVITEGFSATEPVEGHIVEAQIAGGWSWTRVEDLIGCQDGERINVVSIDLVPRLPLGTSLQ